MSESTLANRMEKLETKVEAIQSDMTEVKAGVKRLTDALTGDGINAGIIHDLKSRIEAKEKQIQELQSTIQYLQGKMFTNEESQDIRRVVHWFMGWKLVLVSLIALVPTAMLILNYFKP